MKKIACIIIALIIFLSFGISTFAAGMDVKVVVDGKTVSFPDEQPFIDGNNRTQIPVRFVSEALGAAVTWHGDTRTVDICKSGQTITLVIGESKAAVNGQDKTFDTVSFLQGGRTFVPLRFVSEALGAEVNWYDKASTVSIYTVSPLLQVTQKVNNATMFPGLVLCNSEKKITSLDNLGSTDNPDFFIDGKDTCYDLSIDNYKDTTLQAVKEVLKIYYPISYEKVYSEVLNVINTGIKVTDQYYDGIYFASAKFDDGTTVLMGFEGVKY